MTEAITRSLIGTDISGRFLVSTTVVASPSGSGETIIGSLALPSGLSITSGVIVAGWAAYTIGTSGTAANLRIRQTNVSGTVIAATGALTGNHTAGLLCADDVNGFDTAPADGQVYKLTLTVTAGAAASTVSALILTAIVV